LPGSPGLMGGPGDWLALYLVATNPAAVIQHQKQEGATP
jgi:hypothetical protein